MALTGQFVVIATYKTRGDRIAFGPYPDVRRTDVMDNFATRLVRGEFTSIEPLPLVEGA